jgi:hypothetical protein
LRAFAFHHLYNVEPPAVLSALCVVCSALLSLRC